MKRFIQIGALIVACTTSWSAHATAYRCVDTAGQVSYQAVPCQNGADQSVLHTGKDFSGPLETWQRLGEALKRGDKMAALRELTGDAAALWDSRFDALLSKTHSFDISQLGVISDIHITGDSLAEMTLLRKDPSGKGKPQGFAVGMMRDQNGRWLISSM